MRRRAGFLDFSQIQINDRNMTLILMIYVYILATFGTSKTFLHFKFFPIMGSGKSGLILCIIWQFFYGSPNERLLMIRGLNCLNDCVTLCPIWCRVISCDKLWNLTLHERIEEYSQDIGYHRHVPGEGGVCW